MLNRLLCSDTRASVRSSTTTSGNTSSSFHTEYLPSRDWSAVSRLRHHQTACNMADASWRARTITNSPVWSNSWRLSLISSPGLSTSVATQSTLYVAEFIRSEQLKETHQIHILIFCKSFKFACHWIETQRVTPEVVRVTVPRTTANQWQTYRPLLYARTLVKFRKTLWLKLKQLRNLMT